jgi:tRNA threonylcarbamoyladenosine biosynthesis protein TsaE
MVCLGKRIAKALNYPIVITLAGDLGAGKTTLARGILNQLGHSGLVKSPTFSIVEIYEINSCRVAHFDMYRVKDPEELQFLGFHEYFDASDLILIEWPEQISTVEICIDLEIKFMTVGNARNLIFNSMSESGDLALNKFIIKLIYSVLSLLTLTSS